MDEPTLYRQRFIPSETVCLKDDKITHFDDDIIVTTWKTLKPRKDFSHGASCYYLKKGYKVSKFFDENNVCIYHYCDIIETSFDSDANAYTFKDLLIDVVVYPDGFVKVLDMGEIAEALNEGLISLEVAKKALTLTDQLLNIIYDGDFTRLTDSLKFADIHI